MFVLIHEMTHVLMNKTLTGKYHSKNFWRLFSRIIMRAIELKILNPKIFNHDQTACNCLVLRRDDLEIIKNNATKPYE